MNDLPILSHERKFFKYGWRRLISGIYAGIPGTAVTDTDKFVVYDWDYLTKAGPIIQDAATNKKK